MKNPSELRTTLKKLCQRFINSIFVQIYLFELFLWPVGCIRMYRYYRNADKTAFITRIYRNCLVLVAFSLVLVLAGLGAKSVDIVGIGLLFYVVGGLSYINAYETSEER